VEAFVEWPCTGARAVVEEDVVLHAINKEANSIRCPGDRILVPSMHIVHEHGSACLCAGEVVVL